MSLLLGRNLVKLFAGQEVLRGAELRVEPGEKIGIVGRNGGGKTTLLRLLEGQEEPDEGSIGLAKGARLGYVPQRPRFEPGTTVREHVEGGLEEAQRALAEYERLGEAMAEVEGEELERLVEEHGRMSDRLDALGAWSTSQRVETVLSGIGLPEPFWGREARTLSGGERARTALARELVAVPDLLLLDEPTNHLDLTGIEWLESYLAELRSAVLIVSHDRRLLDTVVGTILELEFGQLTRYPGRYSKYLELKAERYTADLRAWETQRDEVRKEETFIKKHMGSQRSAEAKGRLKRLRRLERLERPHHDVRRPVIRLPEASRGGELVLEAEGLTFAYGERQVLKGVDLRVGRGERIGVVGPNGCGKTTLLKLLAGRTTPAAGEIRRGHKALCGFFDQDTGDLRADSTPFLTLRHAHPDLTDLEIRDHLARFLFRGDAVDAEVGSLSGGERARLVLAALVLSKPSWLALDEPTNHLDLAARTALEEMLGEFPGALVTISHDRAFLDGLCNVIYEIEGGKARRFAGNYSDYRAAVRAEVEAGRAREADAAARRKAQEAAAARGKAAPQPAKSGTKTDGGRSAGASKKPKKKRAPNPYKLERIEKGIMALEEERDSLQDALGREEVYRDPDQVRDHQMRLAEIERDLEALEADWEALL